MKTRKLASGYTRASLISTLIDVPGVNEDSESKIELLDVEGHFIFGNVTVGNGRGDVVVDIVATTGSLYFTGNDYNFESNLTDTVGENTDHMGNRRLFDSYWNSINAASISLTVELHPSGGSGTILPVPNTPITLSAFKDVFALDQEDDYYADDDAEDAEDANFYQKNQTSTHPAKLLFPEVPPGDYDVKVRFFLEAEAELQIDRYETILATVDTKLLLGPHVISVSVIDASHEQCGAIDWPPTASPTDEQPPTLISCNTTQISSTSGLEPSSLYSECGTSISRTSGVKLYRLIGATAGQFVTIDTCSGTTDFDTKLSVWGDKETPSTCIAGNDDDCPGFRSRVVFEASGDGDEDILVHGYDSEEGNFELSVTCVSSLPVGIIQQVSSEEELTKLSKKEMKSQEEGRVPQV